MDQDTFLTTVYVRADDYCKAHEIDWPVVPGPKLSVGEVLTLSLLSRWARLSEMGVPAFRLAKEAMCVG